jgi:hypothetical protein
MWYAAHAERMARSAARRAIALADLFGCGGSASDDRGPPFNWRF